VVPVLFVPSHVGLAANSVADNAAKVALFLPVSNLTVPHSDYKSLFRTQALKLWQQVGILKLRTSIMLLNQG